MNSIELSKLKIKKFYKELVPPMPYEDNTIFTESIIDHGIREPISITKDYYILDGHMRYAKAKELGIKTIPYTIKQFKTSLEEKRYVIECNLERRHLTNYQKIELGMTLVDMEKILAKQRKISHLKQGNKTPLTQKNTSGKKGKSSAIVAKKLKISTTTMEKGLLIHKKAPKEIKEKLRKGEISINTAYNQITKETKNPQKISLPRGTFDVILCNIPITFNKSERGVTKNNYSTIDASKLAKMKIPSAKNAVIFFWISPSIMYTIINHINPLRQFIDSPIYKFILDAWDFKNIKAEIVWDKKNMGMGSYVHNQHKNCIIACKGKMPVPITKVSSIISEPKTKHSKKPEQIYEIIEKMYPKRNYLELFAKTKRTGWATTINEVQKKEK